MDAFKKLKQVFPDANEETQLVMLSPSTRIRIGKNPIQLAPYGLEDGNVVYAAFSKEKNQIYLRLVDFQNPLIPEGYRKKLDTSSSKKATSKKAIKENAGKDADKT